MRQFVTCPNYGHLCQIEYQVDPSRGRRMAVTKCSHFQPPDWVDCESLCVQRLNERDDQLAQIRRSEREDGEAPADSPAAEMPETD